MKRLFIALELPDSCKTTLSELDPGIRGLRWLPPDQLHLTLSFLGLVAPPEEDRLRESLSAVTVPPFILPLAHLGVFNARGRPSVLWVGVGSGHPHLFALHQHLQDAVLHAGLRPFQPHVTVARARAVSRQALKPFLRKHAEHEFGLFRVAGFALFSSQLKREGATHRVEMRQAFE